ncbi:MAG: insulinase family protein [Thermoanaerobaculia bacterium]|nr:insulinase family protein [Thermoanaerobaculia bacterium]
MSLDRSQAPRSKPPVDDFRFPDFRYQRIDDGLDLYSARWGRSPLVALELLLPGGGECDPSDRPGLASFAASLLDEGTERRSGQEIALTIERLGGSLGSGADWNSASVSSLCLAEHLETALDLVADVGLEPSYPDAAVERERGRRLAELRRRRSLPSQQADRLLQATLYAGTTYDHPLIGSEEGLRESDPATLRRFYADQMSGPITLIAVGDVDEQRLSDLVIPRLAARRTTTRFEPTPVEPPADERRVLIIDRPVGTQTELRIGHVGVPYSYPDRAALVVLTCLLGGKFTSRINLNLRERHGYTYGARAAFSTRRGPGPFVVSTAVETPSAGAAAREVFSELERIRDEAVSPEELADTVSYLLGVFPYTLQTADGIGSRLAQIAIHGLAHDHYQRWPKRLGAVTVEDLLRVANHALHPDQAVLVAVGPAADLEPQFAEFGRVGVSL